VPLRVLEQIGVGVYVLDRQGRFRYVNKRALDAWGKRADQILGRKILDVFPVARDSELARAHHDAFGKGEAVYLETFSPVQQRWLAMNLLPTRSRLTVVFRDIQERKLREMRRDDALHQAHDLATIGQVAGGFAHDLSNALTAVVGYIELAREEQAGSRRLDRLLEKALQAAEHGSKASVQLLQLAKKQPFLPRSIDLNAVVLGEAELLRDALPRSSEIARDLTEDLWPALADPDEIAMALLNLALNARDAMPEGGRLTISTENLRATAAPLPGLDPGDYVVLGVSDTGSGMDEATAGRAFEPFFTTKPPEQGSGLGLAQIKASLARCGGAAELHSTRGEGTTVRLYFRRADTAP
jgi:PAS domain S-box-containing protein